MVNHMTGIFRDTYFVARRLCTLACYGSRNLGSSLQATAAKKIGGDRRKLVGAVAACFAVIILVAAIAIESYEGTPVYNCPTQVATKIQVEEGPVLHLKLARKLDTSPVDQRDQLEQCRQWQPAPQTVTPLEQLRAQLECHAMTLEAHGGEAPDETLAFVERARSALGAVHGISQRCEAVHGKLQSISRAGAASRKPAEAIVALGGLAGFEKFARDASSTLKLVDDLLLQQNSSHDMSEVTQRYSPLRIAFRGCILRVVRMARTISQALPSASPAVQRVQQCKPEMLAGLERLALADAELDSDPGVRFGAGLLISDQCIAPANIPFFGAPSADLSELEVDAQGYHVARGLVVSEKMLLEGLEAADAPDRSDRSKACLMRLAKHAKFLADKNQYSAAEWRYRSGAEIAKTHGHDQMAASSLAQLSYFLSMFGKQEPALEAATDALQYGDDSLANYLQATMRLSLGELRSEDQVNAAVQQLKAVEGKLPSQTLEATRVSIVDKLESLRIAADAPEFASCLALGDAAQMLSCFIGRLVYENA